MDERLAVEDFERGAAFAGLGWIAGAFGRGAAFAVLEWIAGAVEQDANPPVFVEVFE